MKIVYNDYIPFKGYKAMNLFGVLFVRNGCGEIDATDINHEEIHTAQMKELWYIGFYLLYVLEWLYRLLTTFDQRKAYRSISFEKEAYENEEDLEYLKTRKRWGMWKGV